MTWNSAARGRTMFGCVDWRPVRPHAKRRLKALAVIANPSNLDEYNLAVLDTNAEIDRLQAGLGDLTLDSLPDNKRRASFINILDSLSTGVDILILVAHGALVKGRPVLYLENEKGLVQASYGDKLAMGVKELSNPPRLAVLLSC